MRLVGRLVRRYAPDGRLDREVRLTVPRPTSVAFGGADLKTLFITTARIRLPSRVLAEAPFSGSLFALPIAVAGLPPPPFAGRAVSGQEIGAARSRRDRIGAL